jgi:carbon monoxide dehydrogenase subunit G
MAHNEIHVDAAPTAVFDVLADPRSFARWVVGSKQIRAADPTWPAAGATFDHTVGVGPLTLDDATTARASDRPRRLELLVRARPFTQAVVTLQLHDEAGGTRIEMDEHAADRRSRLLFFNPLTEPLIRLRNAESLRRLKALAEGSEPIPTGALPERQSQAEGAVKGSSTPAVP